MSTAAIESEATFFGALCARPPVLIFFGSNMKKAVAVAACWMGVIQAFVPGMPTASSVSARQVRTEIFTHPGGGVSSGET